MVAPLNQRRVVHKPQVAEAHRRPAGAPGAASGGTTGPMSATSGQLDQSRYTSPEIASQRRAESPACPAAYKRGPARDRSQSGPAAYPPQPPDRTRASPPRYASGTDCRDTDSPSPAAPPRPFRSAHTPRSTPVAPPHCAPPTASPTEPPSPPAQKIAQPRPRKAGLRAPTSLLISPNSAGRNQRSQQHSKHHRLKDEHERARIPVRIEREERPHAVVVRPVQQQMAQQRDQHKPVQQPPAHRGRRQRPHDRLIGRQSGGSRRASAGLAARRTRQRCTSHTAPSTTSPSNGSPRNVCVMPR